MDAQVPQQNETILDSTKSYCVNQSISVCGKYEILEELGRGGMGIVYKARDTTLGRIVALKTISFTYQSIESVVQRFKDEVSALAKLHHNNIISIYDIIYIGNTPYFAMEYLPYGNLASALSGVPLPFEESIKVVKILAEAIQYAHEQGILHRDLKPSNILIQEGVNLPLYSSYWDSNAGGSAFRYTIKVSDFGLTKFLDGSSTLTNTGEILGTPSYMSPEQAKGSRTVDQATDIYSLGAILYELLTGRPPFRASSKIETLHCVINKDVVPTRKLQPSVPRDLDAVCLKCLEKNPTRRYRTAQHLAQDLERFEQGKPTIARPLHPLIRTGRWAKKNRALSVALGGVVLSVIMLLIILFSYLVHLHKSLTEANRNRAYALFDYAISLCNQDKDSEGLDYFQRALECCPPDDLALRNAISTNINGWQEQQCRLRHSIKNSNTITALSVSTKHELIVTADQSGSVILWDSANGKRRWIKDYADVMNKPVVSFGAHNQLILVHDNNAIVLLDYSGAEVYRVRYDNDVVAQVVSSAETLMYSLVHGKSFDNNKGSELVVVNDVQTNKATGKQYKFKKQINGTRVSSTNSSIVLIHPDRCVTIIRSGQASEDQYEVTLPATVRDAVFCDNDSRVVLVCENNTLTLLHLVSKDLHTIETGLQSRVQSVVPFGGAKGTDLYIAHYDGRIQSLNLSELRLQHHTSFSGELNHFELSPNEAYMLANTGSSVTIMNTATRTRVSSPVSNHSLYMNKGVFGNNSSTLCTVSNDTDIQVWELPKEAKTIICNKAIRKLAVTSDSHYLIACEGFAPFSSDTNMKYKAYAITIEDGRVKNQLLLSGPAQCIDFGFRDNKVFIGGDDASSPYDPVSAERSGYYVEWKYTDQQEVVRCVQTRRPIKYAAYNSENRVFLLARGLDSGIWDLRLNRKVEGILPGRIMMYGYHPPESDILLSGDLEGEVNRIGHDSANILQTLKIKGQITSICSTPNGDLVVVASRESGAFIWDLRGSSVQTRFLTHTRPVRTTAYSKRFNTFLTAGDDGMVHHWDTETGQAKGTPFIHPAPVTAMLLDPKQRFIVSACEDGRARIWDLITRRQLYPPIVASKPIRALAILPNSAAVIVGSDDGVIRIVELKDAH